MARSRMASIISSTVLTVTGAGAVMTSTLSGETGAKTQVVTEERTSPYSLSSESKAVMRSSSRS